MAAVVPTQVAERYAAHGVDKVLPKETTDRSAVRIRLVNSRSQEEWGEQLVFDRHLSNPSTALLLTRSLIARGKDGACLTSRLSSPEHKEAVDKQVTHWVADKREGYAFKTRQKQNDCIIYTYGYLEACIAAGQLVPPEPKHVLHRPPPPPLPLDIDSEVDVALPLEDAFGDPYEVNVDAADVRELLHQVRTREEISEKYPTV
jgi:hypothetical protein